MRDHEGSAYAVNYDGPLTTIVRVSESEVDAMTFSKAKFTALCHLREKRDVFTQQIRNVRSMGPEDCRNDD